MRTSEILSIGSNKRNFKELVMFCVDNNVVPFVGAGMSVPIYRLWNEVLISIAEKSFDPNFPITVQGLLNKAQYEEAASCILKELGEGEFYSELVAEFSKNKIRKTRGMAITVLPQIFKGLVLTTNFEKLLEIVYQQAQCEFDGITHHLIEDNIISELLIKGLTQDKHFLMKIHGDIDTERSLILPKEKYDEVYGSDTLFKQALMSVFESKQLLFLGCSLKNDRTMQLYREAKKTNKVYSYAFVQKPNDTQKAQERSRELSDLLIHPIWYPEDDDKHESVKILLNKLYNEVLKEKEKRIASLNESVKKK